MSNNITGPIENGESGSSVRAKLNRTIAISNGMPASSVLHLDYINGWGFADGEFVENFATLVSNPSLITPGVGLVIDPMQNSPTLEAQALATFIASSSGTLVASIVYPSPSNSGAVVIVVNNSDDSAELYSVGTSVDTFYGFGAYDDNGNSNFSNLATCNPSSTNRFALNYSATKSVMSSNGGPVVTANSYPGPLVFTNLSRVVIGGFDGVTPPIDGATFIVQSLTLYAQVPDEELPFLSAIPVIPNGVPVVQNGPAVLAPGITEVGSNLITNPTFAQDGVVGAFSDNGSGGTTCTIASGTDPVAPDGYSPRVSITGSGSYDGNWDVANVIPGVSFDIQTAFVGMAGPGCPYMCSWQLYDDSTWSNSNEVVSTDDTGNPYFSTGVNFATVSGSWYKITILQTITGDVTGVYFDNNDGYWTSGQNNFVIVFQADYTGNDVLWIDLDQYNPTVSRTVTSVEMVEVEEPVQALIVKDESGAPSLISTNTTLLLGVGALSNAGGTLRLFAVGPSAASGSNGNSISACGIEAASDSLGDSISAFGYRAAQNSIGSNVQAFGQNAAQNNFASAVTAVGLSAAQYNTATRLTAVGESAGYNNDGTDNSIFGYEAIVSSGKSNSIALGSGATATDDNTVQLGNSSVTQAFVGTQKVMLGSGVISLTPQAIPFTKGFADFSNGSSPFTITLATPAAGTCIDCVQIDCTTPFTGGTASAATLELGITGTTNFFATAFDVFNAVGKQVSFYPIGYVFDGSTDFTATIRTTGDTPNDLSAGSAVLSGKMWKMS